MRLFKSISIQKEFLIKQRRKKLYYYNLLPYKMFSLEKVILILKYSIDFLEFTLKKVKNRQKF